MKIMAFQYNYASPDRYGLLKMFAHENKKHATEAESMLWNYISAKQLWWKFNRQYIIGDYIVDFVCLEKKLIIEVDGAYHAECTQIIKDENRTENLKLMGFTVIRFTNEDILQRIEEVLDKLRTLLFA